MAENSSTVFNVHVPEFVDAIWVALRDPTLVVQEKGWYYPKNVYCFFTANRVLADSCTRGNPKEVEPDVIFILIGLREIKDVRLFKILDNSQVFLLFHPLKEGDALVLRQLVEEETRDLSGVPRILF
ncbi:hypothetical protein MTR67_018056 [Solanum verrucosum]|uniref:Uncharacterized protein n=1 Tax=Solanum verrucosum TaxID=315347 RepID=A0AAF0QQ30_SOLVR|nr:hypothetical protein MTR67_018056 [Solanum verrucosum]